MSKYLVPVLSADGIEEEAENLLMQYYPEAMLVSDPDQFTGPTGLQEINHADPPCIFDVLLIFSHVGYLQ